MKNARDELLSLLVARPLAPRDLKLLSGPLAAFAAGAGAVLALSGLLHVLVGRTAWHLDLAALPRIGILAHAVTQMAPFAVVAGLLAALRLIPGRLIGFAATVFVSAMFLALFLSWAIFWATGQFLDRDAIAFGLASPGAMLAHGLQLSPLLVLGVPVTAAFCGTVLMLGAPRAARLPPSLRLALPVMLICGYGLTWRAERMLTWGMLNNPMHTAHPEGGTGMAWGDLLTQLRDERSGPVAYFRVSALREHLSIAMNPGIPVEWRVRPGAYSAAAPTRPYSVVLLIVESLRSDELAAWGSPLQVMPTVDAVAREAAVFLDHVAVASHSSYSSVTPVSSQYPLRDDRQHIYRADAAYPRIRLYDLLAPRGYRTAIISSQNERWGGMANFLASEHVHHFFHADTYDGPTYAAEEDVGFARFAGVSGNAGKIDDRITIDEAIRWIGTDHERPFFVYINLQNSHVPYPIPSGAPAPFGPSKASFPIRFNYFPRDSATVVRGVYRNALHYVDAQIGRLVAHLRTTGQWEKTVFMVMGDHGQAFYEHGFAAHGNELYEELLRTPLIIRAPGLPPGPRRGLAQHVDVAPTVLDLLGLPPHPGFQGTSLLSMTRAYAYATVQTIMANQYSISHGNWKLVLDGRHGGRVLRDLAADPLERRDWSKARPEVATALQERLQTWRAAQLRYYRNALLQTTRYAPVVPEPSWPTAFGAGSRRSAQ